MAISFDLKQRGQELIINFFAICVIFISGILMAISYFILSQIQSKLELIECVIPSNNLASNCQELFAFAVYPVLNVKSVLIYASYFYIFGIVFGLMFLGWRTRKHPSLLVVHILSSVILTYLSIEIANIYRTIIENATMYEILLPFTIYNKIMLYFPQFVFAVVFISGIIGFMGIFRGRGEFNEGVDTG